MFSVPFTTGMYDNGSTCVIERDFFSQIFAVEFISVKLTNSFHLIYKKMLKIYIKTASHLIASNRENMNEVNFLEFVHNLSVA